MAWNSYRFGLLAAAIALSMVPGFASPSRAGEADSPVGVESLLRSLGDLGQLPRLREASCRQFSSYDRSGGNGDAGHFLNGDAGLLPDDTALLAEMDGPGAVVRLWSAN